MTFYPGDRVEVRTVYGWFPATVTKAHDYFGLGDTFGYTVEPDGFELPLAVRGEQLHPLPAALFHTGVV